MAARASATSSFQVDNEENSKSSGTDSDFEPEPVKTTARFVSAMFFSHTLIYIHNNNFYIELRRNVSVADLRGPQKKKRKSSRSHVKTNE
jgi:hypothetical protein